ncbi:branched-chain amino acid ABC transporter permease [Rhizocola hellebori]|uniref:Branched-chain amino acid ABC transporter permease n=1 Tax=Rhizocola hellebori TaxID=1392758 RepID=A0A8J3Q7B5_9ACTN|nr:branched-chain amino acid ABC transporter permease [Rhizocola hellebori]GIH05160.1 branched-chain amino acid ABC transporter permease [Rhizocola hellebori]
MSAVPAGLGYARVSLRSGALAAAIAVTLVAAPFYLAPYATTTLTRMLVFGLFAASLDLLVGLIGLPSLGHAAYLGIGAYTAGWLALHGLTSPLALLLAASASALAGLGAGWISVRSSGIFFLILTLAIGEIAEQIAQSWTAVTGGSNGLYGIPAATVGPLTASDVASLYYYVLGGFGVGMAMLWSVSASPLGAALRGIRDNKTRMRALGYESTRYELFAFVLAAAVAGFAGGLLAAQQRLVTPSDLGFTTSALALFAVVIGGSGRLWAACLGAALIIGVRDVAGLTVNGHGPLLLGLLFIAAVYLMPHGIAGLPRRRK